MHLRSWSGVAACLYLAACSPGGSVLDTEVPLEARQRERVLAPIAAHLDKDRQKLLVEYMVRHEFNDMANAVATRAGATPVAPGIKPGTTVRQALEEQRTYDEGHPR